MFTDNFISVVNEIPLQQGTRAITCYYFKKLQIHFCFVSLQAYRTSTPIIGVWFINLSIILLDRYIDCNLRNVVAPWS